MPGKNISRIEALERASLLSVHGYEVLLDLTKGESTYYSKTVVEFSSDLIGYDTFIDSVGKKVISAVLNDQPVDVGNYDGETIFLHSLQAENRLIIEMEGLYSATGEGLQRSIDPADNQVYMYTQGAPALSRNIFPNFDQPDLKAPFTLSVIAPSIWQVLSNNPLIEKVTIDSNSSKWSFSKTPPISTYLYALIAGPYFHVADEYHGKKVVPLGIYIRNSLADKLDPENIFQTTKQGLAFYENLFDLEYPFAKYDQIAVVDYNWGAMENPGAVTFKEDRFVFRSKVTDRQHLDRASVILHEMAHLWFGDMVTMQWWNDLWLNESFAEWIAYFALAESTRFSSAWVSFNADVKNWAYRADQLSSTHPIATDAPDVETGSTNFDGISYAKGASVLKQLCAYLGDEVFFAGIRSYFRKFAWKNTTLQDLIDELQSASGKDLSSWGKSWFQSAGVNTIVPVLTTENGTYSSLAIKQLPPAVPSGSNDLRTHLIGVGLYDLIDNQIILRKRIELVIEGELTSIPAFVGEPVADLILLNDGDLAYTKIGFDTSSIETLRNHLGKIVDPLARAICWSAVWQLLRDAQLSSTDFIAIALAGLQTEDDMDVCAIVLTQLTTAVENYAHPDNRLALRTKIADALESLLDNSLSGSDFQLQFLRAFAANAQSPVQGARIRSILENGLIGITVDANLRWQLINSLAERGLTNVEEIEKESESDKTQDGKVARLLAIASLPDPATKADIWEKMQSHDYPISDRVGMFQGFQRPTQREILVGYVAPFFEGARKYWDEQSYEVSARYFQYVFPRFVNTQETVDQANNWLDLNEDAPAGLRRFISEGRDNVIRDLAAQAKDLAG